MDPPLYSGTKATRDHSRFRFAGRAGTAEKVWRVDRSESQKTCRLSLSETVSQSTTSGVDSATKGREMRDGLGNRVGVRRLGVFAVALYAIASGVEARADTFAGYQPAGSFVLPGPPTSFDALVDGRILAVVQSTVYRETAVGSGTFQVLGALPGADIPAFGSAFVRVSPDGTKFAIGNNGGGSFANFQVGVFTIPTLNGSWFVANHFDGEWIDNRLLALSAGDFGSPSFITALDTASANPATPSNPIIVTNIGGASGGVAFDGAGNLYAANGFEFGGPSTTGSIYAVPSASWHAAIETGVPVNFEVQGIPIVDLLSGEPIGFDAAGDLVVGGGDSFSQPPDSNYFAIVRASAVLQALGGGGPVATNDSAKVRKLDPDPAAGSFYAIGVNRARTEIYAVPGGSTTAFVYRSAPPAVPALSSRGTTLLAIALALVVGRTTRARRKA